MTFDNTNPLTWFLSLLENVRIHILESFTLPGLSVSYWDFLIGLAIVSIVITVLVNSVSVGRIISGGHRSKKPRSSRTESGNNENRGDRSV